MKMCLLAWVRKTNHRQTFWKISSYSHKREQVWEEINHRSWRVRLHILSYRNSCKSLERLEGHQLLPMTWEIHSTSLALPTNVPKKGPNQLTKSRFHSTLSLASPLSQRFKQTISTFTCRWTKRKSQRISYRLLNFWGPSPRPFTNNKGMPTDQ